VLVGERGALLQLAIGVDVGGIGVDDQDPRRRGRPHRPRTAEHVAVYCDRPLHPSKVRPGQEAEQGGVARQCVAAPQAPGRPVFQQRDVGDEVPAGKLQLDDRAVALTAAVATRADRAQTPAICDLHEAQMIEQFAEEGDACHPGHVVLGGLHHHRRHPMPGPCGNRVLDLEQSRGILHLVSAPCPEDECGIPTNILPGRGALSASFTPPLTCPDAISGSERLVAQS
jgi:hypothetical protein